MSYLARALGCPRDHACDLAQETFCRVWERRATWKAEGSVRGLLVRVARNLAVSEHRRRLARERAASTHAEWRTLDAPHAREGERDELRGALARGIAALPGRRRQVFLLGRVHGLSHKEIAARLGTSPQTVANQLHHALVTLRRELAHLVE